MKVVFLDFDGVIHRVLCNDPWKAEHGTPECVAQLNRITDETGAVIVVSSAWRNYHSVDGLARILQGWGVTGAVVDKTPALGIAPGMGRGIEILHWFDEHLPGSAVILDDGCDMIGVQGLLVQTESAIGLTVETADAAIQMLMECNG